MKKILIKNDFSNDYVTREAGERLRHLILKALDKGEKIEIDFSKKMIASASFFDEAFAKLGVELGWSQEQIYNAIGLKGLHPKDFNILEEMYKNRGIKSEHSPQKRSNSLSSKIIAWRICPPGQYWRSAHIQATYVTAAGKTVHEHAVAEGCCHNPSKKDQIYSEELARIAQQHFPSLKGAPQTNDLGYKDIGNSYDTYIRGWTRFWNSVFNPDESLDANLVKALIASESGFNPSINKKIPKTTGYAHGLMQVTDKTLHILGDSKGELKDHLIHIERKDINDPNLNIAAGTRWLFQKQHLASVHLNRNATWNETIAEYKGVLDQLIRGTKKVPKEMQIIRELYERLKK